MPEEHEQQRTDREDAAARLALLRLRLVVGVVSLAIALVYTQQASQLRLGSMARPGPGSYPMFLGMIFVLVSTIAVLESVAALRKGGTGVGADDLDTDKLDRDRTHLPRLFWFAGALVAYVVIIQYLDFIVTTTAFIIAVGFVFQERDSSVRSRAIVVTVAVALAFGMRWFFLSLMGAPLPGGPLGPFA